MLTTTQGPVNTPVRAENGKFDLENCTPRETRSIKRALNQGQMAVHQALADIPNGRYSHYGLWALFKSNENFSQVRQMLQDLVVLKPMPNVYRNLVKQASSPVIVCISKDHEVGPIRSWWEICHTHKATTAFYALTSAGILLCPLFFRLPVAPEPEKSAILCPIVRKNRYVGSSRELYAFQSYTLLHELIHFYLGDENLASKAGHETYEPNALVALSAPDVRRNPRAYEYYITCTSYPVHFRGSCRRLTVPLCRSCAARLP